MTYQEFLQRYTFHKENDFLKAGGFGIVYKAYDTLRDRYVALKISDVNPRHKFSLKREVELANEIIPHENIARYENCYRFNEMVKDTDCAIMQYYPGGNLKDYLDNNKPDQEQRIALVTGILHGVKHLHDQGVIHRDLSGGNILVDIVDEVPVSKITDFGLSRFAGAKQLVSNSSVCVSLYYAAPEQLLGSRNKISSAVDVWAIGILIYQIFLDELPFTASKELNTEAINVELTRKITKLEIDRQKLESIPEPFKNMVMCSLVLDPQKRVNKVDDLLFLLVSKQQKTKTDSEVTIPMPLKKTIDEEHVPEEEPTSIAPETKNKPKLWAWLLLGGVAVCIVAFFLVQNIFKTETVTNNYSYNAFILTHDINTIKAYQSFIKKYPNSPYVDSVNFYIDSINNAKLEEKKLIAEQEKQKKLEAENNNKQKQETQVANAFIEAQSANTIKAYEGFLEKYSNSSYSNKAHKAIVHLKEIKAEQERQQTIKAENEIKQKYETQAANAFIKTQSISTIKAYETFLEEYSFSTYAGKAQEAIDSLNKVIAEQEKKKNENSFIETVNGVSFKMIKVEGGTFNMGSNNGNTDEKPVHPVTLSAYYIGEFEVTQALWEAVMGNKPRRFEHPQKPVAWVSWYDVQNFIKKLNTLSGKNYSLPTEAEWEFAARGGTKSKGYKYAGSNNINRVACYNENSSKLGESNANYDTHVTGSYLPNELGIYDMSGNVWEWCSDWYGAYSSTNQTNPSGPDSGNVRIRRGGSWDRNAGYCRVANRSNNGPEYISSIMGFRLVLSSQ